MLLDGGGRLVQCRDSESAAFKEKDSYLDNAKIADMEWAIWVLIAAMLGLYIWSHVTAGHRISKKLQPFVDDLFGVRPSERESKGEVPAKPKIS